jgi:hypothetical protein
MLDPWIIEEIKRREKRQQEQPVLELPIHGPEGRDRDREHEKPQNRDGDPPRGIAIIDYSIACW